MLVPQKRELRTLTVSQGCSKGGHGHVYSIHVCMIIFQGIKWLMETGSPSRYNCRCSKLWRVTIDFITVEPLNADPLRCGPLVYPATPIGKALALTTEMRTLDNPEYTNLGTTQYKLTPELWTVVGICQLENCTLSVLRLPPSSSPSEGHRSSPPGLH